MANHNGIPRRIPVSKAAHTSTIIYWYYCCYSQNRCPGHEWYLLFFQLHSPGPDEMRVPKLHLTSLPEATARNSSSTTTSTSSNNKQQQQEQQRLQQLTVPMMSGALAKGTCMATCHFNTVHDTCMPNYLWCLEHVLSIYPYMYALGPLKWNRTEHGPHCMGTGLMSNQYHTCMFKLVCAQNNATNKLGQPESLCAMQLWQNMWGKSEDQSCKHVSCVKLLSMAQG